MDRRQPVQRVDATTQAIRLELLGSEEGKAGRFAYLALKLTRLLGVSIGVHWAHCGAARDGSGGASPLPSLGLPARVAFWPFLLKRRHLRTLAAAFYRGLIVIRPSGLWSMRRSVDFFGEFKEGWHRNRLFAGSKGRMALSTTTEL
jgi:hypothetical protein